MTGDKNENNIVTQTFLGWLQEEIVAADRTQCHLKRIFGTHAFDHNHTCGEVSGYWQALKRVMHEYDTRETK